MNIFLNIKLNINIFIRKQLLNFSLKLLSPTNSLTVALSQNLDKYILMYQREIFCTYKNKHNDYSDNLNEAAA